MKTLLSTILLTIFTNLSYTHAACYCGKVSASNSFGERQIVDNKFNAWLSPRQIKTSPGASRLLVGNTVCIKASLLTTNYPAPGGTTEENNEFQRIVGVFPAGSRCRNR